MSKFYFRPIVETDDCRPKDAILLAGGWSWFSYVEKISRNHEPKRISVSDLPDDVRHALTAPRFKIVNIDMCSPKLMGVINTTPDSFSDGGQFEQSDIAIQHGFLLASEGADFIDVGGESTRPGADFVPVDIELKRTEYVIEGLKKQGLSAPISIDTRKPKVAKIAMKKGASIWNDVTALTYDENGLKLAAKLNVPICLMHAAGDPKTMQTSPAYEHVVLDVYDYLQARIQAALDAGVDKRNLIIDPGIGFGKTQAHNLELLRNISIFHGLGCPILVGVSRKRFIGEIGNQPEASKRGPGSIAVGIEAIRQGVQIIRTHDVAETKQALKLWQALNIRGDQI